MPRKRKGKVVVQHLSFNLPFAGVVWQLLHHLIGFRDLGLDVYYLEDDNGYFYDPIAQTLVEDSTPNAKLVGGALNRFGFDGKWGFVDPASGSCVGLSAERRMQLLREADAVFNLCGATNPGEEHAQTRCMVYLETDPGAFQVKLAAGDPATKAYAAAHRLFFTYGYNLGAPDCALPTAGIKWHPTRPPVLMDQWRDRVGPAEPRAFTTVGTWHNKGNDVIINGDKFYWSKHVNFVKMLDVAGRAGQPIELAMDIASGPEHQRALDGGFSFTPVLPMSLDLDQYRTFVSSSRGEFTVAKDLYARTRSGWFSDRSVCYLAAGRPVITQRTGFEKYVPAGEGLLAFDDGDGAVRAIAEVNRDYRRHARAARALAQEYFNALKLLDQMAEIAGL